MKTRKLDTVMGVRFSDEDGSLHSRQKFDPTAAGGEATGATTGAQSKDGAGTGDEDGDSRRELSDGSESSSTGKSREAEACDTPVGWLHAAVASFTGKDVAGRACVAGLFFIEEVAPVRWRKRKKWRKEEEEERRKKTKRRRREEEQGWPGLAWSCSGELRALGLYRQKSRKKKRRRGEREKKKKVSGRRRKEGRKKRKLKLTSGKLPGVAAVNFGGRSSGFGWGRRRRKRRRRRRREEEGKEEGPSVSAEERKKGRGREEGPSLSARKKKLGEKKGRGEKKRRRRGRARGDGMVRLHGRG